jgi:hypothetical protein
MSSISFTTTHTSQGAPITNVQHNEDVVSFASNFSENFITYLNSSGFKGLVSEDKMNDLLEKQDYRRILCYVWTETNLDNRIAWLEKTAKLGHPILMLELSRTLAEKHKEKASTELFDQIMHWYLLGMHCAQLDTQCSDDISVRAAIGMLRFIYGTTIYELGVKDENPESRKKKAIETISSWTPSASNPSPKWISNHGLHALADKNSMKPESQWLATRTEAHKKSLPETENKSNN